MSLLSAFRAIGQTVAIVTNAGANTASSATIPLSGVGTGFVANGLEIPPCVRVVNLGASPVFISFNGGARVAVVPVAGVNQLEFPVLAGAIEVFSQLPWSSFGAGVIAVGANGAGTPQMQLIVATISTGVSQPLYLTFGEGL